MMWGQAFNWILGAVRSESINWKLVFLAGSLFDIGFKTLLDIRQYKVQCRESMPVEAQKENLMDEKTFKQSQKYSRTKLRFSIFSRAIEGVVSLALLKYNGLSAVYHFSVNLVSSKPWAGEKVAGIITMLILLAFGSISSLPLDYYQSFVIEEKFGFNKSTVSLWIKDTLKSYVLGLVFLPPFIAAMLKIIEYFGYLFVPYLLMFSLAVSLVAMVIYPAVILPWFNKYETLEDGELRTAIENLASSLEFPLGRVYVVDGSQRSSHSNAYFIGFPWYKQIVLFDTLIKDQSTDQIVAVLAHELGHWKRNHMTVLLSMSMVMQLANYAPLALFLGNAHFFESLGFAKGEMPITGALLLYADALSPLLAIVTFFSNYITRLCEYDADKFAVQQRKGDDLRTSLIALNRTNLSSIDADKLYSTFHHSHPIIIERLSAIRNEMKKIE